VGSVFGKEACSNDSKLKRNTTVSYDTLATPAATPDTPGLSSTLGPGLGILVPHNVPTPIMEVPETEDQIRAPPPPDVLLLSDDIPPLQSQPHPAPTTTPSNPSTNVPKRLS